MDNIEQVFFNVPLSKLEPIFKRWVKEALTESLKVALTPEPEKFAYSVKEAAEYFHICPVTFFQWKKKGLVKYTQYGRKFIIDLNGTMENLQKREKGLSH
jgi:hypothetical protein